ncbi:hypothetical protein SO802_018055 [Lithocarpus litseifolius]|uniref:BED-type domain-containing protein n=1 Tax=Lithocarpus litseifolius TaxID=425828 RepID=A0AAW2CLM8_9ROSI
MIGSMTSAFLITIGVFCVFGLRPSIVGKRNKVRKKDHFWEYVEELDGRFKCNFCERDFAGGAPRIKSHLAGVKGRDIDICTKVPDDVQAEAYLAIGGHSKKLKITSNSSNVEQSKKMSTSMSNDLHQTTILEMCKKKDKSAVDKLLTQHIILNNISFNVVQTPAFIHFVQGVAEYGHGYKLPSYLTLRTKLIPNSRIEVEEYISNVKKSRVTTGCTLMSDIWSDMKQRAFINIIAYSPGGAVFMCSIDVSQERKTGFFLKQIISAVIEEIGPNHVV